MQVWFKPPPQSVFDCYSHYLQSSPLLPALSEIATAYAPPEQRSLAPHEITAAEGRDAPSYAAAERHAALPGAELPRAC